MKTIELLRPRGFRLDAARTFFQGFRSPSASGLGWPRLGASSSAAAPLRSWHCEFVPGSGMAPSTRVGSELTLAFAADHTFAPVVVRLREHEDHLRADVVGDVDDAAITVQLGRILGLEADAAAWHALGRRDVIVGKLQREFPGFFTAAKPSPWDAATWAVIAPRIAMTQAARLKIALATKHGTALDLDGEVHCVFPHPKVVARLKTFPGLSDEKCARLRAVAEAALEGRLDASKLRAMPENAALGDLLRIRGIGPWAASHVYFRGAAPADGLATVEPRVLHALALVTGEPVVGAEAYAKRAEAWRPFRMWVAVLLARHLAKTSEWHAPSLEKERAASARALERRLAAARS